MTVPAKAVELCIPSELGQEREALDLAAGIAERMGFSPDRIEDLRTALGEAIVNAIEHGNRLDPSRGVLVVLTRDEQTLRIEVRDHSKTPFPHSVLDGESAPPTIEDRLEGRAPLRGWGVFLIRSLVDEAAFYSTDDGNVAQLVYHLCPAAEDRPRADQASGGK
jgi:serine/threonine-protein kinase RsbW